EVRSEGPGTPSGGLLGELGQSRVGEVGRVTGGAARMPGPHHVVDRLAATDGFLLAPRPGIRADAEALSHRLLAPARAEGLEGLHQRLEVVFREHPADHGGAVQATADGPLERLVPGQLSRRDVTELEQPLGERPRGRLQVLPSWRRSAAVIAAAGAAVLAIDHQAALHDLGGDGPCASIRLRQVQGTGALLTLAGHQRAQQQRDEPGPAPSPDDRAHGAAPPCAPWPGEPRRKRTTVTPTDRMSCRWLQADPTGTPR